MSLKNQFKEKTLLTIKEIIDNNIPGIYCLGEE
jgi:hypothetical protein